MGVLALAPAAAAAAAAAVGAAVAAAAAAAAVGAAAAAAAVKMAATAAAGVGAWGMAAASAVMTVVHVPLTARAATATRKVAGSRLPRAPGPPAWQLGGGPSVQTSTSPPSSAGRGDRAVSR